MRYELAVEIARPLHGIGQSAEHIVARKPALLSVRHGERQIERTRQLVRLGRQVCRVQCSDQSHVHVARMGEMQRRDWHLRTAVAILELVDARLQR